MNNHTFSLGAVAIFCATIFSVATCFAQQKPLPLEVTNPAASSVKAQTTITKPGSYVLTRNITNGSASGGNSVLIKTSNVTIDLQGFVISATGSSTGGGIIVDPQTPNITNVVIRNGIITGFDGPGISAGAGARISGLNVTGNGSGISCGTGCVVRDNVIQGNTGAGITFSDATGGYLGNILQDNNGNSSGTGGQVSGGTSLGQNLGNGVVY